MKTLSEQIWLVFVALFGLALLTSKSALILTSTILILWSFISASHRILWIKNKSVLFVCSLFPIALILNYFSLAGPEVLPKIIRSWPWPLMAAPVFVLFSYRRARSIFLKYLSIGLTLAVLFSLFNFAKYLFEGAQIPFMTADFRTLSFWDTSRWGFYCGFFALMMYVYYGQTQNLKHRTAFAGAFLLTFCSFVLSNNRGPLLAFVVVAILLSLINIRFLKKLALIFVILTGILAFNPTALNRIRSIFEVQVHSEQVTSKDPSNAGRLQMWKVALDFHKEQPWFGTGFESTKQPLMKFIERQEPSYSEKYIGKEFSYNDQHSSYLNTLVQMGTLFFTFCWGGILFIVAQMFLAYLKYRDPRQVYILAGTIYCLLVFVFYSAFNSYESIYIFALLVLRPDQLAFDLNLSNPKAKTLNAKN